MAGNMLGLQTFIAGLCQYAEYVLFEILSQR